MSRPPFSAPHFSVIVPVFRQWSLVPGLLQGLGTQTVPAWQVEILLVNNGEVGDVPGDLALPANARLLACPQPGSYAARNRGAAEARGVLLAFTDADCRPGPGWLAALAAAARRRPDRLLAGPVRFVPHGAERTPFETYDRLRGIPQERYVRHGYATTANLAAPKVIFAALGGFDASRFSGGDAEFCRRALRAGHRVVLVPEAVVEHPCRTSWEALATKARRVKGGQIAVGPRRRRLRWLVRTLFPPLRATLRFSRAAAPWRERVTAIGVLYRLWGVELAELARLLRGGVPERR
jgi:hypothetical protein